jgi:zinc and cadmium transporter
MSTTSVLLVYCLLILLASLVGGLVPLIVKLTHKRMQLAISLVAGFMLGVAVLHLLPHALMTIEPDLAARWLIIGLLSMFFLERFFCFHHHDAPAENPPVDAHDHNEATPHTEQPHDHNTCSHHVASTLGEAQEHRLGWGGAAVGLTIHSIIAGVALAAAMGAQTFAEASGDVLSGGLSGGDVGWPGFAVFLVIVLHKPFDSLTLGTLMAAGGWSVASRHLVNALFALAVPLGALLFQFGIASTNFDDSQAIGVTVAFSAGVFLVISLSDLLPELQFHHHDRGKLSAALLLGVAMAWATSHFEAGTHDHRHTPSAPTQHQDLLDHHDGSAPQTDDHAH